MYDRIKGQQKALRRSEVIASGPTLHPPTIQRDDPTTRQQRILGNYLFGWLQTDDVSHRGASEPRVAQSPARDNVVLLEDRDAPEQTDDIVPLQSDAGVPADAGSSGTAMSASMSITGNGSYADTVDQSFKNVKFNVTWSGGSKEDYLIVNWVKGYVKKPDGTFFKAQLYGSLADINFADWRVDSTDADPAYWSLGTVRWRYTVDAANKFSATDSPGQLKKSYGSGTKARLDFKTAVYKTSDVPTTTSGPLAATPLSSLEPWTYYTEIRPANFVQTNPPLVFDHS